MDEAISIRASSLPTFSDCERRWAATALKAWLRELGHDLIDRRTSIGAHVGTGSHAAVAKSWEDRFAGSDFTPLDVSMDAGLEALKEKIQDEGVLWDGTTPTANAAEQAILKIVKSYREHVRGDLVPELLEQELACRVSDGFALTGHNDFFGRQGSYFDQEGGRLDDLKTGVRMPSPGAQIGAYDLLLEAAHQIHPAHATMTFIKRVGQRAEQPQPVVVNFNRGMIRKQARSTIKGIVDRVTVFKADHNKDPIAFRANPSSFLCSEKFCPAYGSKSWCAESLPKAMADSQGD